MKKRKRLFLSIIFFGTILNLILIFLGLKVLVKRLEIKINEEPKVVEAQFPYNTEFDNYNIEIKKPKVVNHYILFDYTVSTKDNSPIEMEDFYITGSPSFPDIEYFISSQNVLTKVENNKMRIVDAGIIVARKDYDKYVNNFDFFEFNQLKDTTWSSNKNLWSFFQTFNLAFLTRARKEELGSDS